MRRSCCRCCRGHRSRATTLLISSHLRRGDLRRGPRHRAVPVAPVPASTASRLLLALTAAYLFGAILVLPVALSFPEAFGPGRIIGHETTSAILFLSWRVGFAGCCWSGVLLGIRADAGPRRSRRAHRRHVGRGARHGDRRRRHSQCRAGLAPAAADGRTVQRVVVRRGMAGRGAEPRGRHRDLRARARTAAHVRLAGADAHRDARRHGAEHASRARSYSLGWYVSRCSTVISSYLLLVYLAAEFARDLKDRPAAAQIYSYIGAIALAVCAVLLRYFMIPWAPSGLAYTTLYGAVAVAVWMGGWRPGTLTAVLGLALELSCSCGRCWAASNSAESPTCSAFVLYGLSCGVIIALGHKMRAARVRFQKSQEAAIQGYAILRALRDAAGKIVDFIVEYVNPRGAALAKLTPESGGGAATDGSIAGRGERRRVRELLQRRRDRRAARSRGALRAGRHRRLVPQHGRESRRRRRHLVLRHHACQATGARARAARAPAQRADTNKSQFLATLSHELRNPLAPLRNGLAILKRRSGGENADMLAMMDRQLSQLVRLVDDLLDVSRIDRGKIDLKRERVAVDAVVSAAIETARPSDRCEGARARRAVRAEVAARRRRSRAPRADRREPADQRREIHAAEAGASSSPCTPRPARSRSRCATTAWASTRNNCRACSRCSCSSNRTRTRRRSRSRVSRW